MWAGMAEVQVKGGSVVPESVLKKQKRNEEWALAKKQELDASKKKNLENRKLIYNRAKLYAKEYEEQVIYCYFIGCYHICFLILLKMSLSSEKMIILCCRKRSLFD